MLLSGAGRSLIKMDLKNYLKHQIGIYRKETNIFSHEITQRLLLFTSDKSFNPLIQVVYFSYEGFKIIGTHTDSPCLKIAPVSKGNFKTYAQSHVMTYGGGLWHTWFDRDLVLAGKVVYEDEG